MRRSPPRRWRHALAHRPAGPGGEGGREEARNNQKCATSSQMANLMNQRGTDNTIDRPPSEALQPLFSRPPPLHYSCRPPPPPHPHLVHGVETENRRCPVGIAASVLLRCNTALELADEVVLQTLAKRGGAGFRVSLGGITLIVECSKFEAFPSTLNSLPPSLGLISYSYPLPPPPPFPFFSPSNLPPPPSPHPSPGT